MIKTCQYYFFAFCQNIRTTTPIRCKMKYRMIDVIINNHCNEI